MPAQTVFEMATMGGARVMRLENEIGSIEPGKRADLALLDLNQLHTWPPVGVDPVSRIVYSATAHDVETVLINGKIVMENRQLLTIDRTAVLRQSQSAIERVLKHAQLDIK